MSIYRRVFRYYRPFLPQTVTGLVLSFVGIGLNLLKPWPFKWIVDYVIPNFSNRDNYVIAHPQLFVGSLRLDLPVTGIGGIVAVVCAALVVIQFLWGVCNWATNYILVKVGLETLLKLRTDLYAHLQRLSLKFHDTRRSSDSCFRVAYDSQSIQTIYNKGFTGIFGSVVTLLGIFAIISDLY